MVGNKILPTRFLQGEYGGVTNGCEGIGWRLCLDTSLEEEIPIRPEPIHGITDLREKSYSLPCRHRFKLSKFNIHLLYATQAQEVGRSRLIDLRLRWGADPIDLHQLGDYCWHTKHKRFLRWRFSYKRLVVLRSGPIRAAHIHFHHLKWIWGGLMIKECVRTAIWRAIFKWER